MLIAPRYFRPLIKMAKAQTTKSQSSNDGRQYAAKHQQKALIEYFKYVYNSEFSFADAITHLPVHATLKVLPLIADGHIKTSKKLAEFVRGLIKHQDILMYYNVIPEDAQFRDIITAMMYVNFLARPQGEQYPFPLTAPAQKISQTIKKIFEDAQEPFDFYERMMSAPPQTTPTPKAKNKKQTAA